MLIQLIMTLLRIMKFLSSLLFVQWSCYNSTKYVVARIALSIYAWLLFHSIQVHFRRAAKKVNLANIGIVGALDASDEKEKGPSPVWYTAHATSGGSGTGWSGSSASTTARGSGSFSMPGQKQYGSFI